MVKGDIRKQLKGSRMKRGKAPEQPGHFFNIYLS